jgi:hypothetical protein
MNSFIENPPVRSWQLGACVHGAHRLSLPTMIISFLKEVRFALFEVRIDREICNHLFPHLLLEADHGYAFHSDEEMEALCKNPAIASLPFVQEIEKDVRLIPEGYQKCFRYILHRELAQGPMNPKRMRWYRMVARKNVDPEHRNPHPIARAIQAA